MAAERLQTQWHAAPQPPSPYTIAIQHYPTTDDTCIDTLTEVRTYAIS